MGGKSQKLKVETRNKKADSSLAALLRNDIRSGGKSSYERAEAEEAP